MRRKKATILWLDVQADIANTTTQLESTKTRYKIAAMGMAPIQSLEHQTGIIDEFNIGLDNTSFSAICRFYRQVLQNGILAISVKLSYCNINIFSIRVGRLY